MGPTEPLDNSEDLVDNSNLDLDLPLDVKESFVREHSLWALHKLDRDNQYPSVSITQVPRLMDVNRSSLSLLSSLMAINHKTNQVDLNVPNQFAEAEKDMGKTHIANVEVPVTLDTSEKDILKQIESVFGNKQSSERKFDFVPLWVVKKVIEKEKLAYQSEDVYEEIYIKEIPYKAKIISSHHFFVVKPDGQENRLKLRCRLVRHGYRDREKNDIRGYAMTAQFSVISAVLSMAETLGFRISSPDIKTAYLQAQNFNREV